MDASTLKCAHVAKPISENGHTLQGPLVCLLKSSSCWQMRSMVKGKIHLSLIFPMRLRIAVGAHEKALTSSLCQSKIVVLYCRRNREIWYSSISLRILAIGLPRHGFAERVCDKNAAPSYETYAAPSSSELMRNADDGWKPNELLTLCRYGQPSETGSMIIDCFSNPLVLMITYQHVMTHKLPRQTLRLRSRPIQGGILLITEMSYRSAGIKKVSVRYDQASLISEQRWHGCEILRGFATIRSPTMVLQISAPTSRTVTG
nr:hypothetical protein CFP56_72368 [Quercus suber]